MTTIENSWPQSHPEDSSLPRVLSPREQQVISEHAEAPSLAFHAVGAAKGFASGLVVVVPAVLWLNGTFGPARETVHTPAVVISQVTVKPIAGDAASGTAPKNVRIIETPLGRLVANDGTSQGAPAAPTAAAAPFGLVAASNPAGTGPGEATEPAPPEPVRTAYAERLEEARHLALSGDLGQARNILDDPDLESHADAIYLHAETYDPNVLAALGIKDAHADPERSKQLYARAFDLGIGAARQRMEALE